MTQAQALSQTSDSMAGQPPRGRLTLQTVVPTDRRSSGGRAAFSVSLEVAEPSARGEVLSRLLSRLLFTLGEELVGVVAEVMTESRGGGRTRFTFATEDSESLRTVIAQHWLEDRRLRLSAYPLDVYRRVLARLRSGNAPEEDHASVQVMQNQNRTGLIVRGCSLNAVRARGQVEDLCRTYALELVL